MRPVHTGVADVPCTVMLELPAPMAIRWRPLIIAVWPEPSSTLPTPEITYPLVAYELDVLPTRIESRETLPALLSQFEES